MTVSQTAQARGNVGLFAVIALILVCLTLSTSWALARVVVRVTPDDAMMDQRVDVQISGLKAKTPIKLSARSQAQDGLWWRSEAMFDSGTQGEIDLDGQPPLSGSYKGTDGMGLFWSMAPDDVPRSSDHTSFSIDDFSKPVVTVIDVADGNGLLTSISVTRRYARAGVRSVVLRRGFTGTLFEAASEQPRPGVLLIGGSDGGLGEPGLAMLLASHGFAALSLSYFGSAGLPATLERIPMEYFDNAISWMRNDPSINPHLISIYAESRGTEPGLYTAAHDPRVGAVVARSPSFALWGGVSAAHLPGEAAWIMHGDPLPYIPNTLYPDFIVSYLWNRLTGTPVRQTPLFLEDLARARDVGAAEIPVERIRGPVMLLSGEDDQIWPSAVMSDRIMARLHRHAHEYRDEAITYKNVGHPIPYSYLPLRGRWEDAPFAVGGTPEGMAKAQADAWPRILRFLATAGQIR